MADVLSKDRRSYCMSRIRGAGNKETELRMIRLLRANGITGWRRGWPLFGRPDFVFPAARLAVFVDGCFWHGCPMHYTKPANNRAFWRRKLEANSARDRRVNRELKRLGWRILRIWEHDLRLPKPRCMARLKRLLATRFRQRGQEPCG
ncbi:MAG: very short patch repair endonuclease [Planctomycetota bacterium]|nr:very short patch repair endonuclease [Planctomycetota bacterium]